MEKRVLFICKKRLDSYGMSYGLANSASFVSRYLNEIGIESRVFMATDSNCIDREVTLYQPSHIFLEALWVTPIKFKELISLPRHRNRFWITRIHSKIPFIANEGIALPWLIEYEKLFRTNKKLFIAPNTKEFTEDLINVLGIRSAYLPNIYYPPKYKKYSVLKNENSNHIHIGCFGAIRPMKNHLIQAVAALDFARHIHKTLKFHINGNRTEQNGSQVYKNLVSLFEGARLFDGKHHELVEHDWVPHQEFISLIKGMDIGMQVSLTESFNIVAADFISNNIPFIGSHDIDWMPGIFKADPNSTDDIVTTLRFAYETQPVYFYKLNNLALWLYNYRAKKRWRSFFNCD
jgi:hypothetical protein